MSQSSPPRTPPRAKKRRRDVEWSPNQIEKLSKSSKLSTPPRKTTKKRTLLQYLTKPRPRIRINPDRAEQPPGSLTSSTQYRAGDIKGMHRWTDFHLEDIQRKYGDVLKTRCPARQVYPSHRKGDTVQGETEISLRLAKGLITAVNRGLDHAHHEMDPSSPPQAAVQKLLDEKHLYMYIVSGTVIKIGNNFSDDLVAKTPKNTGCVSIEVKPSYNFRARWRSKQEKQSRVDFMQVLAQLNFYMDQRNCRYGCIITDKELICVRKMVNEAGEDLPGHLELSKRVPRSASGETKLTMELALWYLVMLAGERDEDTKWFLQSKRQTSALGSSKANSRARSRSRDNTGRGPQPNPADGTPWLDDQDEPETDSASETDWSDGEVGDEEAAEELSSEAEDIEEEEVEDEDDQDDPDWVLSP
ncbi:hypothetical protein SISNIDRAFT_465563 [Sistotremastrum niveocremeum HHB9708]|uniref:Uncharacterized protein n=1 Tax=Sistotremastrum niveocremeum HHB9708 TaxID=1314777 RepID=A0A164VAL0_9AGAM|nr:hypothetical protein SISNIDRAFT_465563 [Sistotremastrum niveocremeum HHB9708]